MNANEIEKRLDLFFDSEFYLKSYPDIRKAGISAKTHFVKLGWSEKRRPNGWFHEKLVPADMITANPGTPPYILFLLNLPGISMQKFEQLCASTVLADVGHDNCWDCDQMREYFNGHYYRAKYSDVNPDTDALIHFCEHGWKELRDPSPEFDTAYYIDVYRDVRSASINPFVHFISCGIKEGRKPKAHDPVERKLLRSLKSFTDISQEYKRIAPVIKIFPDGNLFSDLLGKTQSTNGVVISFSHDDYMTHTGGVQKFIKDESLLSQEAGLNYLHLCPTLPNISVISEGHVSTFLINCTLDGKFVGTFTASELEEVLQNLQSKRSGFLKVAVIHSCMGWLLDAMIRIVQVGFEKRFFYAHDYFSLCQEYRLLRNNIVPCDAPPLGSHSCNICAHGPSRAKHVGNFSRVFDSLNPKIIYPSNSAKLIFEASIPAVAKNGMLIPHLVVKRLDEPASEIVQPTGKIRIAYCGAPALHKGFVHFEKIVDHCRTNPNLEFWHFGDQNTELGGVNFVPVKLKGGKSIMTQRLRENEIDLVFVGSTWKETFNFIAYEAAEAGAALIATESSGNVADFVLEYGIGKTVPNWQACIEILEDKNLLSQVKTWKESAARLSFTPNKSYLTAGAL